MTLSDVLKNLTYLLKPCNFRREWTEIKKSPLFQKKFQPKYGTNLDEILKLAKEIGTVPTQITVTDSSGFSWQ